MKIIYKNLKDGEIKFRITKLDDLWYLNHIIEPGDLIKGKTERKLELGEKGKKVKKTVFLSEKVDKVEYNKNVLRVGGIIKQGPDEVEIGSHHSFAVEEGTLATLIKEKWDRIILDKLEQATKEREDVLICTVDRENATIAVLKAQGYEVLTTLRGQVEKKGFKEDVKDFYAQVVELLKEYVSRLKINRVIVGTPSIWKDSFMQKVPEELRKIIANATCSTGEEKGVSEVLKRDEVKNMLKEDRVTLELRLVEDLLAEIKKAGKASYGIKDVKEKINMGAVSQLIITDGFLKKEKEEGRYREMDSLLQMAEDTKSQIYIIKSEHEGGRKLDGLGGIGAILRYQVS
ncbi:mRNA surveillance protein pelota [Candidatus Woesearchaeota archaeon]|nr:mRNA surveillance protein pelota [Candidatus Woesearchaeota archaeon]